MALVVRSSSSLLLEDYTQRISNVTEDIMYVALKGLGWQVVTSVVTYRTK